MATTSPKATILAAQTDWARQAGLTPDTRGYLSTVAANLREPMSPRAFAAFDKADGGELRDRGETPAKMRALHSSSALGVNVFSYWEDRPDLTPLLTAMGVSGAAGTLEFERKLPTGAGGTPPNLDVVITTADGALVGIESKFTEWMTPKPGPVKNLAPYLDGAESYWSRACMAAADRIARSVHQGTDVYHHLDVPQLLKHSLGLARASDGGKWVLRYIYFGASGPESVAHAEELTRFAERLSGDVNFRAVSYQILVPTLASASDVDPMYLGYLQTRYGL